MTEQAASRHKRFQQALDAFSSSSRFPLFQGVQIGRLMPDGCQTSQALRELTFGELIEQLQITGAVSTVLTSEQEDELYHLLQALGEDEEPAPCGFDDDIPGLIPDSFGGVEIPTMDEQLANQSGSDAAEPPDDVPVGSVQLELALRSSLAQITSHTRYQEIRKRTVGEFWDPAWTAAPFEEAMSIEQLAGLDLAVLFKKRMVTDTRIQSILRALARAQAHLDALGTAPVEVAHAVTSTGPAVPPVASRSTLPVSNAVLAKRAPLPLSVAAGALVEALEAPGIDWPIAKTLLTRFSSVECAALVLGEDLPGVTQRDLARTVESALSVYERELVEALLRAPAVRIEHIALALFGAEEATSTRARCLAVLVARGLGAVPLLPRTVLSAELWTTNLQLVQGLVDAIQSSTTRRSRSASVRFDLDLLDPYLQEWIQAQGKGKSSRTEKRNRLNNRRRRGR
jgi:hypothetical protein